MNGTEKQIAWATGIKERLLPELNQLENELKQVRDNSDETTWRLPGYPDDCHLLKLSKNVFKTIDAIRAENSAQWFIGYARSGARTAVHAAISGNSKMGGLL